MLTIEIIKLTQYLQNIFLIVKLFLTKNLIFLNKILTN